MRTSTPRGGLRTSIRRQPPVEAGFTFVELIILMAIIGLMAALSFQAFQTYGPRFQMRGGLVESKALIARARLQAIQRRVPAIVRMDYDTKELVAFGDRDGDDSLDLVDPLVNRDQQDFVIGRVALPAFLDFGGLAGARGVDTVDALSALDPKNDPPVAHELFPGSPNLGMKITPKGAFDEAGAFRFTDSQVKNVFELRVTSIAGAVEIRKYLFDNESPTGTEGFFAEANKSFATGQATENIWFWY